MTSHDPRVFNAYSQARYQWIIWASADLMGKKVLDLGCGDGSLSFLIAEKGAEVSGVDNDEIGLEFARKNVPKADFVNASAYNLPFKDEFFDVVVSCEVIEHLEEPEKMLSEAMRVLKKGGMIVLTTPYKLSETPSDKNHVKEYYPSEIKELLDRRCGQSEIKTTHHIFWRGVYSYSSRSLSNRAIGKWLINCLVLWFGWNPFMIDYSRFPAKFDLFSNILAWGIKQK